MAREKFGKFGSNKKEAYLAALREGLRRSTAARSVGVSRELIRQYREAFPGFGKEEEEAEDESCDRVEDSLFRAATGGNVTACQVWLYNRRPGRWKDQRNLKVMGLEDVLNQLPPDLAEETRRELAADVSGGGGGIPAGANGTPNGRGHQG